MGDGSRGSASGAEEVERRDERRDPSDRALDRSPTDEESVDSRSVTHVGPTTKSGGHGESGLGPGYGLAEDEGFVVKHRGRCHCGASRLSDRRSPLLQQRARPGRETSAPQDQLRALRHACRRASPRRRGYRGPPQAQRTTGTSRCESNCAPVWIEWVPRLTSSEWSWASDGCSKRSCP